MQFGEKVARILRAGDLFQPVGLKVQSFDVDVVRQSASHGAPSDRLPLLG
jgi:hypothetical protein